jgi:hypothetical protein
MVTSFVGVLLTFPNVSGYTTPKKNADPATMTSNNITRLSFINENLSPADAADPLLTLGVDADRRLAGFAGDDRCPVCWFGFLLITITNIVVVT